MGLTTWKNSPDGRILKSDTNIAKNYLTEKDIKKLERAITGFFDYGQTLFRTPKTYLLFRNKSAIFGVSNVKG